LNHGDGGRFIGELEPRCLPDILAVDLCGHRRRGGDDEPTVDVEGPDVATTDGATRAEGAHRAGGGQHREADSVEPHGDEPFTRQFSDRSSRARHVAYGTCFDTS
jgi:hypothetical protein